VPCVPEVPKRESLGVLLAPPPFDKSVDVLNLDINLGLGLEEGADDGGFLLLARGCGMAEVEADA